MLRLIVISAIFVCILASPSPERHRLLDRGIIGGSYAKPNQFPYQLSLQFAKCHFCGAALVSREIAITAAHCTIDKDRDFLSVFAGNNDIKGTGERIYVDRSVEHPKYNPELYDYDISIVFLRRSFTLDADINVIALPRASDVIPGGAYGTVSGWGADQLTSDRSILQLKFVQVPIWKRKKCLKFRQIFKSEVFCGGIDSGLCDSTSGDSGGPLVYRNKLFGVVAGGFGCGTPNHPGIYTNVAAYRSWITRITKL